MISVFPKKLGLKSLHNNLIDYKVTFDVDTCEFGFEIVEGGVE